MTSSSQNGAPRQLRPYLVNAAVALAALVEAVAAQEKQQAPSPPGFDYWQPEWMTRELWGPGRMPKGIMARLLRQTTYVNFGVPKEYEGSHSTVGHAADVIFAGGNLYAQNCSACHGKTGMGNGDMGKALSPSPALLAYMINRPIAVDEYLLWSVSEGGRQFDTEMPAFKEKLSRNDIWEIIAYMRAGFPDTQVAPSHK